MKIEFYEEFPNEKNLKKLKLVSFPTKLFIASKSLVDFKKYEKIAKFYKKDLEVAYWPIIKNSYRISPFSNTSDLINLFRELNSIKNSLLIDLELPLRKNWKLYLKNIFYFRKNKLLIKEFLEKNKNRVTVAEYSFAFVSKFMKFLGLNYKINYERSIMWYSSMISSKINNLIKKNLQKLKNKENHSVSLGTTAIGILGNEPKLLPAQLKEDLEFVNKTGFKKVIIFRLEGINKEYIQVLKKFI